MVLFFFLASSVGFARSFFNACFLIAELEVAEEEEFLIRTVAGVVVVEAAVALFLLSTRVFTTASFSLSFFLSIRAFRSSSRRCVGVVVAVVFIIFVVLSSSKPTVISKAAAASEPPNTVCTFLVLVTVKMTMI